MGAFVLRMFCRGARIAKKWEVLPVSMIAVEASDGEGPGTAVDMCVLLSLVTAICCFWASWSTQCVLGVPLSYSFEVVVVAALARLLRSGRL